MRDLAQEDDAGFTALIGAEEMVPGSVRGFTLARQSLVLCRAQDAVFPSKASAPTPRSRCPRDASRASGSSALFMARKFSVKDGRHLSPPAYCGLRTFAVHVREGVVEASPGAA